MQDNAVDIDFTGDGTRVVVAESKGRVLTLDAESLKPAGPTIRLDTDLNAIKASPDNRTAIVFTSGMTTSWSTSTRAACCEGVK